MYKGSVLGRIMASGLCLVLAATGCSRQKQPQSTPAEAESPKSRSQEPTDPATGYEAERKRMVDVQLAGRDITDERVLDAMRKVPRHELVPADQRAHACEDRALPIADGQTISQPYVVAAMTQLARLEPGAKVLEVGTGSGYQAAVLAEIGVELFSIEIIESLHQELVVITRTDSGFDSRTVFPVAFVPMTGEAQK